MSLARLCCCVKFLWFSSATELAEERQNHLVHQLDSKLGEARHQRILLDY